MKAVHWIELSQRRFHSGLL